MIVTQGEAASCIPEPDATLYMVLVIFVQLGAVSVVCWVLSAAQAENLQAIGATGVWERYSSTGADAFLATHS